MKRGKMKKLVLVAMMIGVLLFGFSGPSTVHAQPSSYAFLYLSYANLYYSLAIISINDGYICDMYNWLYYAWGYSSVAEAYAWQAYMAYYDTLSYDAWNWTAVALSYFSLAEEYGYYACYSDYVWVYYAVLFGSYASYFAVTGNVFNADSGGIGQWSD